MKEWWPSHHRPYLLYNQSIWSIYSKSLHQNERTINVWTHTLVLSAPSRSGRCSQIPQMIGNTTTHRMYIARAIWGRSASGRKRNKKLILFDSLGNSFMCFLRKKAWELGAAVRKEGNRRVDSKLMLIEVIHFYITIKNKEGEEDNEIYWTIDWVVALVARTQRWTEGEKSWQFCSSSHQHSAEWDEKVWTKKVN